MFKWIRNYFRVRLLSRAFKQVADEQWKSDDIDMATYAKIVSAAHDKPTMLRAINRLEAGPNMLGGIQDWNWEAILQWVRENLIPALKIILPLVLLLDEEK